MDRIFHKVKYLDCITHFYDTCYEELILKTVNQIVPKKHIGKINPYGRKV